MWHERWITRKQSASKFVGQTWDAYRPGEDVTFRDQGVSRHNGELCSVVGSLCELERNAILCGVTLRFSF